MNIRFFRLARISARKSTHRIKIGSVLIHKGQVLNIGWNKIGHTHPKYPYYLHSEMDACLGLDRRNLSGAVLYLFRINSLGVVGHCKPCGTCQDLLKELGIKAVYYTTGRYDFYGDVDSDGDLLDPEYKELVL